jgi:hyperosmotically inducible periplasmic protein
MRRALACTVPVLLTLSVACSSGSREDRRAEAVPPSPSPAASAASQPDNTAVNERDRGNTLTPGDQAESSGDIAITQNIRKAIVAEDSLTTTAQNVKIITANGVVTLRGPVNTPQEKTLIASKAQQIAGVARVDNQLEVISR